MDDGAIARNVWYLKERGFIDVSMTTGDPPYTSIQITREGRKAIESHNELLSQQEEMMNENEGSQYDVFISHASEDKAEFVRPLATALDENGLDVWYDEFELNIGDSLRDSIDRGLANSDYGIVVLSEAYFEKDWAQYELNGLVARDVGEEKVILPIWYNIDTEQVMNNSPTLADKYALRTDGDDISEVVVELRDTIDS
jgi:DNA-binding MarR family transcriptional regulator